MKIYAYVILENHMHLIAQSDRLDRDTAYFKSYTAKKLIHFIHENKINTILDQLAFYKKAHKSDRAFQFWQEGVHPEWIQNEEIMRQKSNTFIKTRWNGDTLTGRSIGGIQVREIIWGWKDCWRSVCNGRRCMHSHAGAWERETP